MEKTLVLLKPDTIQRGLVGKLITRFEEKGLTVCGAKMMNLSDDILKEHYSHIADKPFFPSIMKFMQATPVIALCLSGRDVVSQMRKILGATDCCAAETGTIRSDFGNSIMCNLVHASDSLEASTVEIKRFFKDEEIFEYEKVLTSFVYEA